MSKGRVLFEKGFERRLYRPGLQEADEEEIWEKANSDPEISRY